MVYIALIAAAFFFFGSADLGVAGIYRYVDENGVIHFTNCPKDPKFQLHIRESKEDVGKEPPPPALGPSNPLTAVSALNPPAPSAPAFSLIDPDPSMDSNNFESFIIEFAKKYGVDSALIKAMIRAESGFNPYAVSRKGAKGLMQLMPETALRMNVSNVFNPKENIEGGVRYFKYLLSLFNNDVRLSLAAYNAGENIVAQLGTIPPYRETVDYVRKVLNYYRSYKQ
jgi:soluble lytic murein transglycosylase-like protein